MGCITEYACACPMNCIVECSSPRLTILRTELHEGDDMSGLARCGLHIPIGIVRASPPDSEERPGARSLVRKLTLVLRWRSLVF